MMTWLIRAALVAAAIAGIVYGYTWWRDGIFEDGQVDGRKDVQTKWDNDKILRQAAALELVAKARKDEQEKAAAAATNAKVEYANEKVQAVATARAAGIASGMSRSIASLNASALSRGMPTVSSCPSEFVRERDAGILARQLLDQCSSRYQRVAEAADGLGLKLDTALKYIAIVAPALD